MVYGLLKFKDGIREFKFWEYQYAHNIHTDQSTGNKLIGNLEAWGVFGGTTEERANFTTRSPAHSVDEQVVRKTNGKIDGPSACHFRPSVASSSNIPNSGFPFHMATMCPWTPRCVPPETSSEGNTTTEKFQNLGSNS